MRAWVCDLGFEKEKRGLLRNSLTLFVLVAARAQTFLQMSLGVTVLVFYDPRLVTCVANLEKGRCQSAPSLANKNASDTQSPASPQKE